MIEESKEEAMSKRPDASVRIRCHNHECRKIFVVNLVKEQHMPDGKKVEMVRPCPYCGKDNAFKVEGNIAPVDVIHRIVRGVIEGREA